MITTLLAAFGMGLMGAGHCLGMCGGIVGGLSAGGQKVRPLWLGCYHLGRVSSYTLMGFLAAGAVSLAPTSGWPVARTLAGVVMIFMGLYVANLGRTILLLERVGQHVWRWIQPMAGKWLPIQNARGAWVVGLFWGWLPCGLVYAALAYASGLGQPVTGGLAMLAFGLGTLPALLMASFAIRSLGKRLNRPWLKGALGLSYMAFGAWTIWVAWAHSHHNHQDHSQMSTLHSAEHHHVH